MANCNCLEGMCCPECGQEDEFRISATVWATVGDDGVQDYGDTEWDDGSACICPECGFSAKVGDFMKPDDQDSPGSAA